MFHLAVDILETFVKWAPVCPNHVLHLLVPTYTYSQNNFQTNKKVGNIYYNTISTTMKVFLELKVQDCYLELVALALRITKYAWTQVAELLY